MLFSLPPTFLPCFSFPFLPFFFPSFFPSSFISFLFFLLPPSLSYFPLPSILSPFLPLPAEYAPNIGLSNELSTAHYNSGCYRSTPNCSLCSGRAILGIHVGNSRYIHILTFHNQNYEQNTHLLLFSAETVVGFDVALRNHSGQCRVNNIECHNKSTTNPPYTHTFFDESASTMSSN